ncbi:MAG: biotin--[acetyl-CoA-carboxylase] ligase [Velocimicrobium sp.]
MKSEILKMLLENKTYVSGQKMCEELGVSRTAIWKTMNQLKEEGYRFESVTNKGYRIISCPDLLTKEAIEGSIKTKIIGKHIYYKKEVTSTNTVAKQLAEEKGNHGLLVTADMQSSGKGRRGRSWISPNGSGIWMSLILEPMLEPIHASMLTLVAALAAAKGICEVTMLDAKIKWPNDIVVNKKKVCGILTEMNTELDYINYVIVGIGINANMQEFPEEIKQVATSLLIESGKQINRSVLICKVMEYFELYYEAFIQKKDASPFLEEYNMFLINRDKTVKIIGEEERIGVAKGINARGELLVMIDNQEIPIMSGEVSVRGLYGYV